MGQALYRSYRSRSFDEVVGQDHITKTLKRAIKSGRLSHAYLFSGPRGVGKTSVARILAHEINNLDYKGEEINLDIIEIDAASNRRIDEIRDLRDKVHITPTSSKYKVYIIDEVHMLTREAFNALLKTLEEPPEHCIFILATTEAHKLPETIISRTQQFVFRPINRTDTTGHLANIAKSEKISIDKDALELIADHSGGSFRDSISLLDQLSSIGKHISAQDVRDQLGIPADEYIDKIMDALEKSDPRLMMNVLKEISGNADDHLALARAVAARLRAQISNGVFNQTYITLLKEILLLPSSPNPEESLEIILLEAASTGAKASSPAKVSEAKTIKKSVTESVILKPEVSPSKTFEVSNQNQMFDMTKWEEVLELVKSKAASVYTALRIASPVYEDAVLKLYFEFPLHQKKINQAANKNLVSDVIAEVYGRQVELECVVDKKIAQASKSSGEKPREDSSKEDLMAISNIFGKAEVLES